MSASSRPYVESIVFLGGISADIRTQVAYHPDEESPTVWGRNGALTAGGRAAGAAVAAARLGRRFVDLIGCVGDDMLGRSILDSLKHDGVSVRLVDTITNVPTGIRQVVTDSEGKRRTVGASNANAHCLEAQVLKADSTIFGADMLFATLEVPLATVNRVLRTATGRDVPVLLDASPFPTAEGIDQLEVALLGRADILLVNWSSAQALTGLSSGTGPMALEMADKLLALGPKAVVTTMGQHGAMVAVAGRHAFVAAGTDTPIDASSAGDAFAGGLAVGLTNQAPKHWTWDQLHYAVRFATATAAVCIGRIGGQTSLPTREEVERHLMMQPLV